MTDHLKTLRQYNIWRRGTDESVPMIAPAVIGEAIDAMIAEVETLRALIRECAPIVIATAEAEHLLDGFGPRRKRPLDALAERIKAATK